MEPGDIVGILLILLLVLVVVSVFRAVFKVHQGYTVIVERLGRYHKTYQPGLHFLVPFFDTIRQRIDMREQVVPFPPQTVITSDNINVSIDTVIYYQVTNPEAATYEIANPMSAIEQLAVTTMRNIIGTMDMEQALTGRDQRTAPRSLGRSNRALGHPRLARGAQGDRSACHRAERHGTADEGRT